VPSSLNGLDQTLSLDSHDAAWDFLSAGRTSIENSQVSIGLGDCSLDVSTDGASYGFDSSPWFYNFSFDLPTLDDSTRVNDGNASLTPPALTFSPSTLESLSPTATYTPHVAPSPPTALSPCGIEDSQRQILPKLTSSVQCKQCSRFFSTLRLLKHHHRRCHNTERSSFRCEVCNKMFGLQKDFERHKRSACKGTASEAHHCTCGKKYPRRDSLLRHIHSASRRDEGGTARSTNPRASGADAKSVEHRPS